MNNELNNNIDYEKDPFLFVRMLDGNELAGQI